MAQQGMKRVFITALTDNVSTDKEGLGTIRREGQLTYKWVEFSGTNAVAAGDAVCYTLDDLSAANPLTKVDKANSAVGAGVAVAAAASGSVSYGWIQVSGFCTVGQAFGGPPVAGNELTNVGAAAGVLEVVGATAATSPHVATCVQVANKQALLHYPH